MTSGFRSPWIAAFAVAAVLHLALIAADATPWDSVVKCVLAPLLLGWVVQHRGPRLLVVALVGCFFGDLFLELDEAWFPAGMGAFAVAHVCFIAWFVQRGAARRLTERWWVVALFAVAAAGLIAWCWSGLPADIQPLVPFYALLLSGTGATALMVDLRAGVGGLLFMASDSIIAASQADRVDPDSTVTALTIMALYIAALWCLTTGIATRGAERHPVAA